MENKYLEEKLNSKTMWTDVIDPCVTDHFIFLGFDKPADFMEVRLFDLLNLDCVDNNRAEEMILGLSRFLYPERDDYSKEPDKEELEYQMYIAGVNHNPDEMTIGELLEDEFLSEEGLLGVFDWATQRFYKSDEYDSRHYKYGRLSEIKKNKR